MIVSGHPGARGKLREITDEYLGSLLRHAPACPALAPGCRATVNAVATGVTSLPPIDDFPALQIFTDPQRGEVAVAGVAKIAGALHPFALRLRVESERILEAEALLSNTSKGHFADVEQLLKPDVLYDAPVALERASDRAGLTAAADSYWTGLQESDGSIPKFAYRCDRFDNGKKITNNLSILLSPEAAVLTCASGLNATRPARPVARNRRFPVLDVSLGVVVSFVLVDFKPNPQIKLPGMTHYMMGLFKIVDGEIRSLDEITEKLPFGSPSGW
ncbi:MAG: hypothetical protein JWL65_3851 [Gammaproteobacteria bacterium]|nr:hypothetical protein [Gammaproteobacteria bacterium]